MSEITVLSNGTETSAMAAEKISRRVGHLRARVYCLIQASGSYGMTADEILVAMEEEIPGIGHQSISQRPGELRDAKCIRDKGREFRRPTRRGNLATVWVANSV